VQEEAERRKVAPEIGTRVLLPGGHPASNLWTRRRILGSIGVVESLNRIIRDETQNDGG
jgi:hypothetical protein